MKSICPHSAASLSVLGLMSRSAAALVRLSPRFDTVCSRTINRDPMAGSQSSDALTRPSIAVTGPQFVSIENNQVVIGDED